MAAPPLTIPLATDDIVEIVTYCRLEAQSALNVWLAEVDIDGALNVGLGEWAAKFSPLWGLALKNYMSENAQYAGCTMRIVSGAGSEKVTSLVGAGDGVIAGDVLPAQAAGLVSFRTGFVGRKYRGRKYYAFPGESDSDNMAHPADDVLARLDALAQLVLLTTKTDGGITVNLHGGLQPIPGGPFYQYKTFSVRREWATQRRRSQINKGDPAAP